MRHNWAGEELSTTIPISLPPIFICSDYSKIYRNNTALGFIGFPSRFLIGPKLARFISPEETGPQASRVRSGYNLRESLPCVRIWHPQIQIGVSTLVWTAQQREHPGVYVAFVILFLLSCFGLKSSRALAGLSPKTFCQ